MLPRRSKTASAVTINVLDALKAQETSLSKIQTWADKKLKSFYFDGDIPGFGVQIPPDDQDKSHVALLC